MVEWTHNVAVHESAAPAALRGRIASALRNGVLHPSLLYSGLRQTTLWTALHHAVSPAQADPGIASLYEQAFQRASSLVAGNLAHVVSLACGDGAKDLHCLRSLRSRDCAALYTPADISLEMALTASQQVRGSIRGLQCTPVLFDLEHCSVLPGILKSLDPSGAERLILFLGTIHNYDPKAVLKNISNAVRAQDQLLIGANLAPAEDYENALARILPQYDNEATRVWLWGALSELGLSEADGVLRIQIEGGAGADPKRFQASFEFGRRREVLLFGERVEFAQGDRMRVFCSQRFTAAGLQQILNSAGLNVRDRWVAPEEGLFLCRREGQ